MTFKINPVLIYYILSWFSTILHISVNSEICYSFYIEEFKDDLKNISRIR